MAKQKYRANSQIIGLRKKDDAIAADEEVVLDDEQAKSLLAPRGPLELVVEKSGGKKNDVEGKKPEEDGR